MNAQERRRATRADKHAAWKQANLLLVGVKANPDCRPILTLNRKPVDCVVKAVEAVNPYQPDGLGSDLQFDWRVAVVLTTGKTARTVSDDNAVGYIVHPGITS